MALKDPYVLLGAILGFALILLYVVMEISYRGGLNLDNLHHTISLGNSGRVIGLLLTMESVTGGIKLVLISLTAELPAPFDGWDWLYILVGGVGAFWAGLAGIIEIFAVGAASLSESDSQ